MDARPRIRNQQQLVVVPMRGKAASLNIGLPEVRAKLGAETQRLGCSLRDPGLPLGLCWMR